VTINCADATIKCGGCELRYGELSVEPVLDDKSTPGHEAAKRAADAEVRADFPADPRSPIQARSAVRHALETWNMPDLSDDAQLLASELVANAVEHAGGKSIGFALRRQADVAGHPGVICEVSDSSSALPQARGAAPAAERGRGLAIVEALASESGVRTSPVGKTAWFRLALARAA
jgi:anti-sigma regulatory factor (Ser/Thr protein kinase)